MKLHVIKPTDIDRKVYAITFRKFLINVQFKPA